MKRTYRIAEIFAGSRGGKAPAPESVTHVSGYPESLFLYRPQGGKSWWVHYAVAGRTLRKPTNSEDRDEAISFARRLFHDVVGYRLDDGRALAESGVASLPPEPMLAAAAGDLYQENRALRRQIEALLAEARLNEEKMRRFDQFERRLIAATSLIDLIGLVLDEYKAAFGVECITLFLIDREYEVSRILEAEVGRSAFSGLTLLQSPEPLQPFFEGAHCPRLEPFDPSTHGKLFAADSSLIASVALLPLVRQNELIGSLHFGSASAERYVSGCGTAFLERLAAVIGVCLGSALVQERMKLAGLTDGLTGIQNRRYFDHRCDIEIIQARRYKHALACMFLDIDRFKGINDRHGHQTGDEVLRTVAGVVKAQLRAGDTIARYGGEEFVALLPRVARHHALEIAERIRKAVAESALKALSGEDLTVTISIGVAMLPDGSFAASPNEEARRLLAIADQALYEAKNTGRNRVVSREDAVCYSGSGDLLEI